MSAQTETKSGKTMRIAAKRETAEMSGNLISLYSINDPRHSLRAKEVRALAKQKPNNL